MYVSGLTLRHTGQSNAIDVIAAIALVAKKHFVLVRILAALGTVLAVRTLPVVVLDTHRHARWHLNATGMG